MAGRTPDSPGGNQARRAAKATCLEHETCVAAAGEEAQHPGCPNSHAVIESPVLSAGETPAMHGGL